MDTSSTTQHFNNNSFLNSTSQPTMPDNASKSNFLSSFKDINATTVIIIIIILAFLGINIFVYLAKGTEEVASLFRPIIKLVTGIFAYLSSTIIGITASGTRNIVDQTTSVIDSGLDKIESTADKISEKTNPEHVKQSTQNNNQNNNSNITTTTPSSLKGGSINNDNITWSSSEMDKVFNAAEPANFEADQAGSTIQSGNNKTGWCYIGEDRGFRSCIEVNKNDMCMSEDIYPSKDVCVNPNLRY